MPGLTITTGRVPSDAGATTGSIGSSGRTSGVIGGAPDAEAPQNDAPSPTRPPVSPITPTQESARLSSPGHGDGPNQQHQHRQQHHTAFSSSALASASSHSPTPPLSSNNNHDNNNNNTNIPIFAQGRPTFTHSQPDQIGIQPPPPQPIAFDDNPDVLALKSAITILQLQRQRATVDIQALNRAKVAALSDPGAFVADLSAGRIGMDGDPLLNGPGANGDGSSDDDDDGDNDEDANEDEDADEDMKSEGSDDNSDEGDEEETSSSSEPRHDQDGDISMSGTGAGNTSSTPTSNNNNINSNNNNSNRRKMATAARKKERVSKKTAKQQPQDLSKTWRTLPKPQTVVRCPPINWAQYAVVGESLDKLHQEQLMAPTLGVPAVVSPGGVYEFRGTATATTKPGGGGGGGGGNIGSGSTSGSGTGYTMGDTTMGSSSTGTAADRTTTPPTTVTGIEGYANTSSGQQQTPGDTQGQGQGQGPQLPRHQQPQRLVGIAAPYTPGRDKIDRGTGRKGSKR
ncbi:hypothetical protein SMACR_04346 [Sordaria macrospora]|uniref:WGS project CABT00000000 data, contig 2.19 n=2 Tax=Sordaria macrospora TaxID=5147 RepID=F7W1K4_SORMK|nr:uncharacterized protein SMAC_04346 [Sordaria macrospora k-hell]KAA8635764.1 hypothetical protein SMACR_04346 [Sordaria macrospora]WPJ57956.1 hypothetical protein SMAC4_04346 [Sordaria macrospora]CCC04979.1 unnamed protein product [Sordaria macrospora k-hell]